MITATQAVAKGGQRRHDPPLEFKSSTGKDGIDLILREIYTISENNSPAMHFLCFLVSLFLFLSDFEKDFNIIFA